MLNDRVMKNYWGITTVAVVTLDLQFEYYTGTKVNRWRWRNTGRRREFMLWRRKAKEIRSAFCQLSMCVVSINDAQPREPLWLISDVSIHDVQPHKTIFLVASRASLASPQQLHYFTYTKSCNPRKPIDNMVRRCHGKRQLYKFSISSVERQWRSTACA
jgi:hypothetical protein